MFCKAPAIIDTRIEDFLVHGRDLNVSTSCLDKGDDNTVARCGRYFLSETDTAVVVTKWYELTGGGDRGWPKPSLGCVSVLFVNVSSFRQQRSVPNNINNVHVG